MAHESEDAMNERKRTQKYDLAHNRFEARPGEDPEYPIDVYSIVGQTQDEYYENSYVSLEAARVDFPGITMQGKAEGSLHIAPLTCPKCGEREEIDEADSRHFGEQERRSFHCPTCDNRWYQWEWVKNSPYRIEYEGRDYDLREVTPGLQDAAEAARELLFGPIAQRMLEYASIEEQTELFAVRGMLKNALS